MSDEVKAPSAKQMAARKAKLEKDLAGMKEKKARLAEAEKAAKEELAALKRQIKDAAKV